MNKAKLGLYAYCITNARPKIDQLGIDGKNKVYASSYKDISALVSKVALGDFKIEEKKAKDEEGMEWIKKMALAHEVIVETLMKTCQPLLPMKFCTIFKGNKQVEGVLKSQYLEFKQTLARLKDKEEWGIKMYADFKKLSQNQGELKKKAPAQTSGKTYLLAKKKEEEAQEKAVQEVSKIADKTYRQFKKFAFSSVLCELLPKRATGKPVGMILNSSYLVPKEGVAEFKHESKRLQDEYMQLGFEIACTGPWPPYNFLGMKK